MADDCNIDTTLGNVKELATFLHDLFEGLPREELRDGDDLLPYAEKLGVRVPGFLEGEEVAWDASTRFEEELGDQEPLVLVLPGRPEALGLTIGCLRVNRVKVCLECGWFYCRIVIKGRF